MSWVDTSSEVALWGWGFLQARSSRREEVWRRFFVVMWVNFLHWNAVVFMVGYFLRGDLLGISTGWIFQERRSMGKVFCGYVSEQIALE